MDYKTIIASSWLLTRNNKRLIIWYGFFPALLTTLVGIITLLYQVIATYQSQLFSDHPKSVLRTVVGTAYDFVTQSPKAGIIILIIVVVIAVFYILIPTILQGGMIQLCARIHNKQKVNTIDGVSYGLLSFLPLFEYHLMIKGFGVFSFVTEAAFIGRNLGWSALQLMFFPLLLFTIIGFFLILLFTYTEYYIVIDKESIFTSIRKSAHLVIKHWAHTFLILILMLIISLRIILNIILVLAIPALIIIPAGYLANVSLASIGYALGGIIGLIALIFAAYLGGILDVFASFVWVKTFLCLTEKGEVEARDEAEVKK